MSFHQKSKIKIKLLVIGKTSFPWLEEGIALYEGRLNRYTSFQFEVVPDVKNAGNLPPHRLMELEAEAFLKRIGDKDDVILLDDKGRKFSSESFADFIEKRLLSGDRTIVFVVGGAFGFGESLVERAAMKISLSEMTFSHQMVRLIFAEQLYRAFTIIRGEPYHHK